MKIARAVRGGCSYPPPVEWASKQERRFAELHLKGNLKAFVLAAGYGTRLWPLTEATPKCLLPIRGKPILEIWLELCAEAGIDEILINVHCHAEQVRSFLGGRTGGPNVIIAQEPELLGSAGTLMANRGWVHSEPFFWVFYADVLTSCDLRPMLKMHLRRNQAATLGVYRVPDPSRCGIVETTAEDMIEKFVEKPSRPASDLAFAGILIGSQALLDAIPPGKSDIGYDVLPRMAGKMVAYRIVDYLVDIGTMENYRNAQVTWPGMKREG